MGDNKNLVYWILGILVVVVVIFDLMSAGILFSPEIYELEDYYEVDCSSQDKNL